MLPSDKTLSDSGLEAAGQGRFLLLACGALAREILDLRAANGWNHFDLKCLPAKLHLYPDQIPPAVEEAVQKHRADYDAIYVVYADCGTGGQLQALCDRLSVQMIKGPHCYSFFEGNQTFTEKSESEFTAFYLTDFLVRQFDAFVWKPMGLDRHPELRDMIFGHYTTLIYQAQTDDPALDAAARDCADRLGLDYVRRFTGYGDLQTTLSHWAQNAPQP
jgi:hypothetical protein